MAAVKALIADADVVVQQLPRRRDGAHGPGLRGLPALNPRIVYAVGTGFGETGPYAHKGGQDVLAQAMTRRDGAHGRRRRVPVSIYPTALADYSAGMHMVQGILLALLQRERTGEGQKISVSLYNSMLAMQMQEAAMIMMRDSEVNWAAMPLSGVFDTPTGRWCWSARSRPIRCATSARRWRCPTCRCDARFADLDAQFANKAELQRACSASASPATRASTGWRGWKSRTCCRAPVRDMREALVDPQTLHNEMILEGSSSSGRQAEVHRQPDPHVGRAGRAAPRAAAAGRAHGRGARRGARPDRGGRRMSVRLRGRDHVATVTIDRPEVLNAIDLATEAELQRIWSELERRDDVRVVVLTGAGERAFCVGADMKNPSNLKGVEYWAAARPGGFGGIALRETLDVPVIARVNGFALGGGFEMVLGCDIVVACEEASFGLPEPLVGRLPLDGGMTLLQRQIPLRHAMGMLLTGQRINARRALEIGLINEVVPRAELDAAVERWVQQILACAPLSVQGHQAGGAAHRHAAAVRGPGAAPAGAGGGAALGRRRRGRAGLPAEAQAAVAGPLS